MPSLPTTKKPNKLDPSALPDQVPSLEMQIFKFLLIIMAGLFIYAPSFHGGWLWDDDQEITQNAVLRDTSGGLIKIWKGEAGADYLPLKSTFQWVLFNTFLPAEKNGQVDSTGYHLVNVFLDLIGALLVWKLMLRLGLRGAWLGGLLFAIHPIMVESVAWVSELKNTLSMPLLLLSMLAYINYDEREKTSDLILSAVLFLASGLVKASVIMYPVTILLFCWWRRGTIRSKDLMSSAPFFLVSLILAYLTIHFQWERAIAHEKIPVADILLPSALHIVPASFWSLTFWAQEWAQLWELPSRISWVGIFSRTATAGMSILWYLYKSVLPFDLLPIYPKWDVNPPSVLQLSSWVVIIGGLVFLWIKRNVWGRGILFGLGFFLISLFPIIGFIKMSYMRITWAADHLIYLPVLGLICLIAAALGDWYYRADAHMKRYLLGFGVAAFGLLVWQSHWYAGVFANEYEMWTYTLKHNPNAWQAHSRLGKVLLEMGRNDDAFSHIKSSVDLRPDLAETHNNYGAMLEKKGDTEGALVQLRAAVDRAPDVPIYRINLASLLVRLKSYDEGREVYESLLNGDPKNPDVKGDPNNPTFLCNYGVALFFLGKNDEAIAAFQKALSINPDLKDAKENLATALKKRDAASSLQPPPPAGGGLLGAPSDIKLFR
ncbi:tetratricopeptide repeat protein [soil metagenome]